MDTPTVPPILKFFAYSHLPERLRKVSEPCATLASAMVAYLPPSAELTAGLRKQHEAKDCFVRAELERPLP